MFRIIHSIVLFLSKFFARFDPFGRSRTDAPEVWPKGDPLDVQERLTNGRKADALLNDPMLCAVMDAVGNKYRAAWENSPRGDIEAQRVAHLSLSALKDVQGALRAHLGSAKLLEADLAERRRRESLKSSY